MTHATMTEASPLEEIQKELELNETDSDSNDAGEKVYLTSKAHQPQPRLEVKVDHNTQLLTLLAILFTCGGWKLHSFKMAHFPPKPVIYPETKSVVTRYFLTVEDDYKWVAFPEGITKSSTLDEKVRKRIEEMQRIEKMRTSVSTEGSDDTPTPSGGGEATQPPVEMEEIAEEIPSEGFSISMSVEDLLARGTHDCQASSSSQTGRQQDQACFAYRSDGLNYPLPPANEDFFANRAKNIADSRSQIERARAAAAEGEESVAYVPKFNVNDVE